MKLSYSRIATFDTCPRKFIKEQEMPGFDNIWMRFGSKVHTGIEGALTFGEMPAFTPEEAPLAKEMIDAAVAWIGSKPVKTEVKFALDENLEPMGWEKGVFRGVVDVIIDTPEGLEIVDWKTGHVTPDRTQIMIYAMAMKKLGYDVSKASYYMLRFNNLLEFFVSEQDIQSSESWLRAKINDINSETEFAPIPSRECQYCSFVEDCPVSSVTTVTTEKDAVEALKDVDILNEKIKRSREKVNEYIKRTGSIIHYGERQYGMKRDKNGHPYYGFL